MTAKEESRKIAKQIVDLYEEVEGRAWNSEEQEKFDRLTARADELKADVEAEEARAAQIATYRQMLVEQQDTIDEHREFGQKRESAEGLDEKYTKRFNQLLTSPPEKARQMVPEMRAIGTQVVGTSGYGGILVPTAFQTEVLEGIKAYGGMRKVARIIRTSRGGTLRWPLTNDVANEAKLLTEAAAASTSKRVTFNVFEIGDYKLTSGPVKISREMQQDGVIDVTDYVRGQMVTRFGRGSENHYANSTGGNKPTGLWKASTNAAAGGVSHLKGSSNLTPELLIDLQHAVDPGYRDRGVYMMRDPYLQAIRKLRFGTSGPFIWQPSFQSGVPDMILGKPYVVNNSMSTAKFGHGSSDIYPIWFGDFQAGMYIRDCLPITITVLTERYADEDVLGVIGFMRTDSKPASSNIGNYPLAALRTT